MDQKSLLELVGGAIMERVDFEVANVIDNIMDPNTDPKKPRKITLEFTLTPGSDRKTVHTKASVKTKLEPTNPIETQIFIGADHNGELVAVEAVPQVPGQSTFDGELQREPAHLKLLRKEA